MTRLEVFRRIVTQPRQHNDRTSLVRRDGYDKPDGREQMDNPRLKPRTYAEWERRHGRRSA